MHLALLKAIAAQSRWTATLRAVTVWLLALLIVRVIGGIPGSGMS
jgi:hypothetical protein